MDNKYTRKRNKVGNSNDPDRTKSLSNKLASPLLAIGFAVMAVGYFLALMSQGEAMTILKGPIIVAGIGLTISTLGVFCRTLFLFR